MAKKLKIQELSDDKDLLNYKTEIKNNALKKASLDNFSDDTSRNIQTKILKKKKVDEKGIIPNENLFKDIPDEAPLQDKKKTKTKKGPKNVEVKEVQVQDKPEVIDIRRLKITTFNRSLVKSYITKLLGLSLILVAADAINHFFKFFDGVNVMDFNNYQSVYLMGAQKWIVPKVMGFLIFTYMITPKDAIWVNRKGIFCSKTTTQNFLFYSGNIYLSWDEIYEVKFKTKLFEPYLILFDASENKIGMLHFAVDDESSFFKYIGKNAGEQHPLYQIKDKVQLF